MKPRVIIKTKKKPNLVPLDDNALTASASCEFGPDGIKFIRANINITKNGMCKVSEDQVLPLAIVQSDEIEFGAEIGRGASGFVQQGIYKPAHIPIAIKTMNVFDKNKRHQVVNDLKIFLQDKLEYLKGNQTEFSNHLVQVYGAYYDEGSIRIIMELMDAGSLRDILNMARNLTSATPCIKEPYLANIAYQILSGLYFVHTKKKQLHRDIKPENVLINTLGQVKLTDFGISKQLEQTQGFSKTFVGTVTYMSPERLRGELYSSSSDLWSLGIVLMELATGEYPYQKTSKFLEMLENITNSPEPNLPDDGRFSMEFRDFIKKCLNKDPLKRETAAKLMEHPWLLKNDELNLDISEWVSNLVFTCNYGYKLGARDLPELEIIDEEIQIQDDCLDAFQNNNEEEKYEQPEKIYSFGEIYDGLNNIIGNYQKNHSTPSQFMNPAGSLQIGHHTRTNSSMSRFGEYNGMKGGEDMDLEVINLQ